MARTVLTDWVYLFLIPRCGRGSDLLMTTVFEFIFDAFIKIAAYMCILQIIAIECIYVDG